MLFLLLVGLNFLTHKSPILLSSIDLNRKKIDENVLCLGSPGCCSQGSSGSRREKSLVDN